MDAGSPYQGLQPIKLNNAQTIDKEVFNDDIKPTSRSIEPISRYNDYNADKDLL